MRFKIRHGDLFDRELLEHDVGDFDVGELAAEEDAGLGGEENASLAGFFCRGAVRAFDQVGVERDRLRAGVEEQLDRIVAGLAVDIDGAGVTRGAWRRRATSSRPASCWTSETSTTSPLRGVVHAGIRRCLRP